MHITENESSDKRPYFFFANGKDKGIRWVTPKFVERANALARKKNFDIQFIPAK